MTSPSSSAPVKPQRSGPCEPTVTVPGQLEPPPPAAVRAFSHSDPLPFTPLPDRRPTPSAESLKPGADAVMRPKFTYPRFSMVTTLANTGGPGFSIEELTSTEVSEDEDALMHEPCLRRRTLPRLSWQPSTLPAVPSESGSQLPSDRLQKTTDYLRHILVSLVQAFMAYLRTADKPHTEAGAQHENPPQPYGTPARTRAQSS